MRALRWPTLVTTLLCLVGCLGDPVGPGGTLVVRRLSPLDSVLVGAPGRVLPAPITFQVIDGDGRPMPGAVLTWAVAGTDGRVDHAPGSTDSRGEASVVWQLGTKASEDQGLTAQAAVGKHHAVATVGAVAKPVEVSSIAFVVRDTALVKLGVATLMTVQATDPFGNKFVPSGTRFASLDTSLCLIDSLGSVRARRRGFARVVALAGSAADTAWVHPIQVVHRPGDPGRARRSGPRDNHGVRQPRRPARKPRARVFGRRHIGPDGGAKWVGDVQRQRGDLDSRHGAEWGRRQPAHCGGPAG